jgi:hypothetical protein
VTCVYQNRLCFSLGFRRKRDHPAKAAKKASRLRFRTILLIADHDHGTFTSRDGKKPASPIVDPLSGPHRFRHAASTVLVLLVVPVFYAILGDLDIIHFSK